MRKRWRDFAGSHPDIDCETPTFTFHSTSTSTSPCPHPAHRYTHGIFFCRLAELRAGAFAKHAGACLKNRSGPGKPDNECFFLSCREELSFQGETIMKKFSYRYLIYRPSVIYSSPIISLIANRYQRLSTHARTFQTDRIRTRTWRAKPHAWSLHPHPSQANKCLVFSVVCSSSRLRECKFSRIPERSIYSRYNGLSSSSIKRTSWDEWMNENLRLNEQFWKILKNFKKVVSEVLKPFNKIFQNSLLEKVFLRVFNFQCINFRFQRSSGKNNDGKKWLFKFLKW